MKISSSIFVVLWATVSSLLFSGGVLAKPLKNLKRQVIQDQYDFIILGCGTAGSVVLNRLSESGKNSVLCIEDGPVPTVVAAYEAPGGNQFLGGTAVDWRFYTTPQEHLNGRVLPYHRGRGLGGSSIINGIFYGRGSASVWDKWVELGNPGWGWSDVYPLFQKSTHFNPPDLSNGFDHRFETWEPSAYGDGPLEIGFQGYVPNSNIAFIQACEAANIPIVKDLNTGNNTGVKQGTGCLDSRLRRSSGYDSYIKEALGRPNLDVLSSAPAQSLLFSDNGGTPTATGVVFVDEPTGLVHEVTARKEIIIAMGAFQSPQFLMINGIGPTAVMEEFGIAPVFINENVGQHLNDHHVFSIYAQSTPEASTSQINNVQANLIVAQEQYYANLSGPYTAPSGITNGFQMLSNERLIEIGAKGVVDAGLVNQSHVEFLYESIFYPGGPIPGFYTPQANLSYISVTAQTLVALSRGNVTIRSTSMGDAPLINPNYYADPNDRAIALNAFKDLRKIFAHPALSQFTVGRGNGEVAPGPDVDENDEETVFEYIKLNTIPNWHASGTNIMLPQDQGGVVDSRLRVYGVNRLRVIDCSIIPRLLDVNIQGPVFIIGENGAKMIREDWGDL